MEIDLYAKMAHLGFRTVGKLSEYQEIDKEIAESIRCKKCGGDCFYEGFEQIASYRAFAVCSNCGNYIEI